MSQHFLNLLVLFLNKIIKLLIFRDWLLGLITAILLLQIVIRPDPDNVNTTVTMEVPVGAKASGTCEYVVSIHKFHYL